MWGIIPAAGQGTRIQPLAFSKELLPVGSFVDRGQERPRAVGEYLAERMVRAGADRLCFVISPTKSDIVRYFGGSFRGARVCYTVQGEATGLCDAIFRALPLIDPDEHVLVGLPDTVWFPEDGLDALGDSDLSFLLFPVDEPRHFDAVVHDDAGRVREIQVKRDDATSSWIWGAFKARARVLGELQRIWSEPGRGDPYIGTLVNEYLRRGGEARAVRAGRAYVDVGTLDGYRRALELLESEPRSGSQERVEPPAADLEPA